MVLAVELALSALVFAVLTSDLIVLMFVLIVEISELMVEMLVLAVFKVEVNESTFVDTALISASRAVVSTSTFAGVCCSPISDFNANSPPSAGNMIW